MRFPVTCETWDEKYYQNNCNLEYAASADNNNVNAELIYICSVQYCDVAWKVAFIFKFPLYRRMKRRCYDTCRRHYDAKERAYYVTQL